MKRVRKALKNYHIHARSKLSNLYKRALPSLTNYRWLRYVVMIWAIRMAFLAIAIIYPVLSSLAPNNEVDVVEFNISRVKYSNASNFFDEIAASNIPCIIEDVPVSNQEKIMTALRLEFPSILEQVKVSESPAFTHFSNERSWSSKCASCCTHRLQHFSLEDFLSHRSAEPSSQSWSIDHNSSYVYMTRHLRNPESNVVVQSLAPVMDTLRLHTTKRTIPEVHIWLGSSGVIATPHYDMEHNFFLQVNGSKRFTLTSPALYSVFRPYSALHPSWRQSQYHHLTSTAAILSTGLSGEAIEECLVGEEHTLAMKEDVTNCGHTCSATSVRRDGSTMKGSVHDVTLTAGQMLYLPPFYFHSVTTLDSYSVSINSWVGSRYLTAAEKLSTLVPLPYATDATIVRKFASVGALIKFTLIRLGKKISLKDFQDLMVSRVADVKLGESGLDAPTSCEEFYPFSECDELSLVKAEQTKKMRVAAEKIGNHLSWMPPSVQRVVLLDYFEELFDVTAGSNLSSPRALECFAYRCLAVKKFKVNSTLDALVVGPFPGDLFILLGSKMSTQVTEHLLWSFFLYLNRPLRRANIDDQEHGGSTPD